MHMCWCESMNDMYINKKVETHFYLEMTCGTSFSGSLNIFKGKDVKDNTQDDLQNQPCTVQRATGIF